MANNYRHMKVIDCCNDNFGCTVEWRTDGGNSTMVMGRCKYDGTRFVLYDIDGNETGIASEALDHIDYFAPMLSSGKQVRFIVTKERN